MTSINEIQNAVFQQSRNGQAPVGNVLRLITDWTVLKKAWKTVASRSGKNTAGDDGVTVGAIQSEPGGEQRFLNEIADNIQKGTYTPGGVRCFRIPKKNGDTRKLAVLTVADRVVHTAVKLVLEPILEAKLGKQCYGFRPGRSR